MDSLDSKTITKHKPTESIHKNQTKMAKFYDIRIKLNEIRKESDREKLEKNIRKKESQITIELASICKAKEKIADSRNIRQKWRERAIKLKEKNLVQKTRSLLSSRFLSDRYGVTRMNSPELIEKAKQSLEKGNIEEKQRKISRNGYKNNKLKDKLDLLIEDVDSFINLQLGSIETLNASFDDFLTELKRLLRSMAKNSTIAQNLSIEFNQLKSLRRCLNGSNNTISILKELMKCLQKINNFIKDNTMMLDNYYLFEE